MDWQTLQVKSDEILAQGLHALNSRSLISWQDVKHSGYGLYLIHLNGTPVYAGEAKNLTQRLKQQFGGNSTFYPSYTKTGGTEPITNFQIKWIDANIGRKELEEFCIVNVPTPLNRFQLNKRNLLDNKETQEGLWEECQASAGESLALAEINLLERSAEKWHNCNIKHKPGVYLIYDSLDELIYIGESSDIADRYITHSKTSYFSAFRRHVGTNILSLTFVDGKSKRKNREFKPDDDAKINQFIRKCKIRYAYVQFGRMELEEYLIRKHRPLLNRKENKG